MEINLSKKFFKTIELYKSLPDSQTLPKGRFEVSWVGPNWFQSLAKNGLGVLGFKNWVGKEFSGNEFAINIFSDETVAIDSINSQWKYLSLHPRWIPKLVFE